MNHHHHCAINRRAFTLVELLVVISIIAVLIAMLLPALKNARDTAHISICASRQHQLLIGLFARAADHDGALPPGSGYSPQTTVPLRALRGSGDFFDELLANGVTEPQVWYCPASMFGPDTSMPPGSGSSDTFYYFWAGDANITIAVYCNLWEKGGYTDIPRTIEDPSTWVLTNDSTFYSQGAPGPDMYWMGNHPGFATNWLLSPTIFGRDDPGAPRGVNTGTLDGSVAWTPQPQCILGYPGFGGDMNFIFARLLEPPQP